MHVNTAILTLALLTLGGVANSATAASPELPSARMHRVNDVLLHGHPAITTGTSLNLVRQTIGSAREQLTPNLWLYRNFRVARPDTVGDDCSDLIIHFVHERVANIYLANPRAHQVILARVQRGASERVALGTELEAPATKRVATKD